MVREIAMSASALALLLPAGAAASEVLPEQYAQVDTRLIDRGFAPFDRSLGKLLSIRLDVTPNFTRAFRLVFPGVVEAAPIAWDASDEEYCYRNSCVNLQASGNSVLDLTYSENLPGSYGYQVVKFGGPTLTMYLHDPVFTSTNPYTRIFLPPVDPGLYDESLVGIFDTTGAVSNATNILCENSISGCDNSLFKLTYTYAPGGVPEPATWLSMLLGFFALGWVMRGGRKTQDISTTA